MIDKGLNVLITGACRGIGSSIALAFSKYEANIFVWDINDNGFDELKQKIENNGSKAFFNKVDVSDFNQVQQIAELILNEHKYIDVLINNAGITKDVLFLGMKEEDFDSVINVNLKGTFNVTKAFMKSMLRNRKGNIINISSVIGIMGNKGQANYAASKAGIIGLTKSIAKEIGQRNIRVNAIAPGFINTEMTKKLPEEIIKSYLDIIPLKRMGEPEDVANICLFLSSKYSSYITGQVIKVDGGMLM